MDALQIIMALMLTLSEPCTAMPDMVTRLDGRDFKVETYVCGVASIKVWSRWCPEGQGFWSRPFLMEDNHSGKGVYLNRFAELEAGWHVSINEVYSPSCGS